jgi:hypothetical protein
VVRKIREKQKINFSLPLSMKVLQIEALFLFKEHAFHGIRNILSGTDRQIVQLLDFFIF